MQSRNLLIRKIEICGEWARYVPSQCGTNDTGKEWISGGKLGERSWGLDPSHFQQKNESALFVEPSLFKMGVSLTWKRLGLKISVNLPQYFFHLMNLKKVSRGRVFLLSFSMPFSVDWTPAPLKFLVARLNLYYIPKKPTTRQLLQSIKIIQNIIQIHSSPKWYEVVLHSFIRPKVLYSLLGPMNRDLQ